MQYTAFYLDEQGRASPPIATGVTRVDALSIAAARVLKMGVWRGSIGVQEQNDISADEFAELTKVLDEYFSKLSS